MFQSNDYKRHGAAEARHWKKHTTPRARPMSEARGSTSAGSMLRSEEDKQQ